MGQGVAFLLQLSIDKSHPEMIGATNCAEQMQQGL